VTVEVISGSNAAIIQQIEGAIAFRPFNAVSDNVMPADIVHGTIVGERVAEEDDRIPERLEPLRHTVQSFADPHFSLVRHGGTDVVHDQPPNSVAGHAGKHNSDQAT